MKKRILSILLSICMLLSVVPMMGITASAAEIDRSGWTKITGTTTISADGNYYLNGDVVGNITVNSGVTATIDLNGYVLKGNVPTPAQGTPGSVILNHGTLTILDNSPDAVHYFTYNAEGAWVLDTEAPVASDTVKIIDLAAFSLNAVSDTSKTYHIKVCGGCITGSVGGLAFSYTEDISETEHLLGSGVYNDGTLNVNGGNICGNEGAEGAGIGCYNGTLNLNGGNICGNYVTEKKPSFSGKISNIKPKGAGVCCIKSTGSFNGCNVIGNSGDVANLCMGGGVYACSDSNLTISAGNISNNTARDGGGLYILKSVLTMNGGTVGYNNASAGGGVFLDINAVFTLKNGCIEGNTAESGGGLYLATKTYCYMYGGYIKDNEATEQAGGFFSNGYFYMYGGSIADNTANIGGGVFVALNASFCSLGGSITGNTANIGGGVYSYYSIGVASTGVISENTADIGGGIYANSNIDISSGCYVKGNTKTGDSSASNIYLKNGKTICYVDDPEHPGVEENVGVTLESGTGKATASAQEDYSKFFFSDNPDYDTYNSGKNNDQFVYIGAPVAMDMRKEYLHETVTDAIDALSSEDVVKTGTVKLINNAKEDVTIDSDTTITLDMCGYTLTGTGNGSVITNNGTLTLNNGTVTGGAAENGGAVNNTGKLTAKAVTFTGNSASGDGGAIYCGNDAQILLNGCTLKNNTASNNGGALCMAGGEAATKITSDKCVLIDTVIEQNSATLGGGVYYKKTTPGTGITVTFETGEFAEYFGNVSSITKLYHTGDTYGELPDFDNSYYRSFDGWYTESSGGTKVSATDVINATEDFTLYARKNTCFAAGTLITMANGTTKKIEDISEGDVVKTFDHESGTVSSAEVYLAYKGETTATPFTLTFDNDATLSIVGCHDLLEQSSLKYITLSYENVNDYIGKCFYGEDGAWHKLVSVICETTPCEYYSLYTAVHQNCYANGFLSVPDDADYILKIYELDENLKANEEQLSADIKEYGLASYEYIYANFGMSREYYDAANGRYEFIIIGKGFCTEDDLKALYNTGGFDTKQPQPMFTASPMFASAGLSAASDPVLDDFTVGVLAIGDGTKISNNTGGNLYLADDDSLITLYGTRSDMCVGITTATAPTTEEPVKFTTNGTKDDEAYFFSDNTAYADKYNSSGYLELVIGYLVNEETCTNGSVSVGNQKSAYEGETVTITATPHSNCEIDKVYYNDGTQHEITPVGGAYSFTMPAKAVTVSATFTKAKSYVCFIDANKNGTFDGSDVKYTSIADALTAAGNNATVIRLIDNVTEDVTVTSGKTITLDLNGKTLRSTGTSVDNVKHNAITNYATLTVTDTSASGSGKITGGTGTKKGKVSIGGGVYNSFGSFTMLGGTISGNSATLGAGVANVDGGTFTMLGGTITGNTVGTNGGGVYNDGTIIIGGTAKIENNTIINTTTANNLYLNGNKATIATGDNALKPGAIIGVTLSSGAGQFTVNGENADKYHFFSDSDAYGVKYNTDGYLELVVIDYSTMPKMNFSANLTLAQNIDIGITVAKNNSSAVNIDADKLKIYANGEVVTLNDELEGTLAKVEPKDIGTLTGVTVEYDGIIVKGFGYSVAKYCVAAFKAYANDSDTYASLNTLCEAILNYGKWAEDYANEVAFANGEITTLPSKSTVNAGHEIDFSKVNLPTSQKIFTSNTTYGATGSGAYLTLESTVKLNYYVKSSFAYNNSDTKTQNFFILNSENKQIDPKKVSVSEAEGGYIISIDLYAYQLGNEYTLKVKGVDSKDFEITFGVYDYCVYINENDYSATLKTLCKAIYSYSEAVRAYSAE